MIKRSQFYLNDPFLSVFIDYKKQPILKQIYIKEWSSVFVFKEYCKLLDENVRFIDTKELNKPSIDLKMRNIMQDFGLRVDS
ncbi:hypothetical protein [Helicobacter sp. WB40]|uniref:hypothetical protein n=1 Tax=Helicobacter sp. WB40 TaxID=3004130 RepID=UPI0022EC0A9A|nr:hypothetical protein [Helicobacter sp. WB40]MDA3967588.1 hypothetical protein [Helicobacter sp. WB40]